MKKFMIFLLMAFLYLGTCQARSEALHFINAKASLPSWAVPTSSHSFFADVLSAYDGVVVKVTPTQPQSVGVNSPDTVRTFAVSVTGLSAGVTPSYQWYVNGQSVAATNATFAVSGYPAGTYNISCKVTANDMTYSSNVVILTVTEGVVVNIVGPTYACVDGVVTLTAQVPHSNVPVHYQWRRNGNYIVGATSPTYSFAVDSLPGLGDTLVYEFDVEITRSGCEKTYSPVHYFSVSSKPFIVVDVPMFCAVDATATVTVTAHSFSSGDEQPYKWIWKNGTRRDTTYTNTLQILHPVNGAEYEVTTIYQDNACNGGPQSFKLKSYEDSLLEDPNARLLSLEINATNENICAGGNVRLSVRDVNKSNTLLGDVTYAWTMDGRLVENATDSVLIVTLDNSGQHTFDVQATYANYPCANALASQKVITVDTMPMTIAISGNNQICLGASTILTANVIGGGAGVTYAWDGSDDFDAANNTLDTTAGVHYVVARSANGCEAVSNPFEVVAFGANMQIFASETNVCNNSHITLSAHVDGYDNSNVSYDWNYNNLHGSIIDVVATTTNKKFVVEATTGECHVKDSIIINVNEIPAAPQAVNELVKICAGEQVTLTAQANNAAFYTWYMDGFEIPGENLSSISVNLNEVGDHQFSVSVTNAAGCTSDTSRNATVRVNPAPQDVYITGLNIVAQGQTATLTAHATGANSFTWSTTETGNTINAGAGTYYVTANSDAGCTTLSDPFVVVEQGSNNYITATPAAVCAGESVELTAYTSGWNSGTTTYAWVGVANGNTSTVLVTPNESRWYVLISRSSLGDERRDSIYVTVHEAPAAPVIGVNSIACSVEFDHNERIPYDTVVIDRITPRYIYDTTYHYYKYKVGTILDIANASEWYEDVSNPDEATCIECDGLTQLPIAGSTADAFAALMGFTSQTPCTRGDCNSHLRYYISTQYNHTEYDTTYKHDIYYRDSAVYVTNCDTNVLVSDTTICLGTSIMVPAYSENAASYQWFVDGVAMAGQNGDSLLLTFDTPGEHFVYAKAISEFDCISEASEQLHITVEGAPTLLAITGENVICDGGHTTLTASAQGASSYQWYGPVTVTGNSATLNNATAGVYTFVATSENGCQSVSDPITVEEFGLTPHIYASSTNICPDEHVTLTVLSEGRWNGNIAYTWSSNVPDSIKHNPTIDVVPAAGENRFTVTATFGQCSSTASVDIFVNEAPVISNIAGTTIICQGGQATISATATGAASFQWFENGVEISGDNLSEITRNFNEVGSFEYIALAYSEAGCVSNIPTSVATVTVKPAPTLVTITGENVIAEGTTTTLTANGNNITSYLWSTGATTVSVNVPAGVYTVTVSNGTCQAVSDPFTVVEEGSNNFITAYPSTEICEGQTVELTAHTSGWASGTVTYAWNDEHNAHGATVTVAPTESRFYTVTSTSSQGITRVDSIYIIVNHAPAAPSVTPTTLAICAGSQAELTASTTGAASYTWYQNGVVIPGENLATIRVNLDEAGIYAFAASATSAEGCVSGISTPAAAVTVKPVPTLVTITGDNVICEGNTTRLTVNGNNITSYQWSNGATTASVNVPAGVYTVTVSNGSCQSVSEPFTVEQFGADLQISASATNVCAGDHITLTADADGWTGNVSYKWYQNSTLLGHTSYTQLDDASSIDVQLTTELLGRNVFTVVASTSEGCSKSAHIEINVNELPGAPGLVVANPIICAGNQTAITAVPAAPIAGVVAETASYVWYEDGVEIPGQNLNVLVVNPETPGTHVYSARAISLDGCVSLLSAPTATVTVLANPTVEIAGDPFICTGTTVNLTANANDNDNPMAQLTYDWRINNASTGIHTANYSQTMTAQDQPYIYTVVVENAQGCVAESHPYFVYVGENPTVEVTVDYNTVCAGGQVTATAHLGDYNMEHLTYQWYKGGQLVAWATEPTFTTTITENNTELKVVVTQTQTQCTAEGSAIVRLMTAPAVTSVIAINGSSYVDDLNVCEGAEITVSALVDGADDVDNNYNYIWTENGRVMPLVHGASFTKQLWILDSDPATYTYTAVIAYDIPGCSANPVTSNTVEVRRNPIAVIDGVHNVCFQGVNTPNVHLTAWVDGEYDVHATYNWYRNGALTHNDLAHDNYFNEMIHPTNDDPIIYTVEVVNGNGCSSFSEPFEVNVFAKPVVNILASETRVCRGAQVELNARINDYNDPMLTLQWYENQPNNAHLLAGRTHEYETFTMNETTTFYAHVKHLLSENTTEHSLCDAFDTLTIFVVDDPIVTVENDLNGENAICDGRAVTFTATVAGGVTGGEVFTWYRNGEVIPNAVASVFSETVHAENNYPTEYNYAVSVKQAANGCESTVVPAGTFTVNPNPTIVIATDPIVCSDAEGNIHLTANVTPAPATEYSLTWYEDNAVIAGLTANDIVLTRPYRDYPYNFSVSLVNDYGCQALAETQVYVDTNPVINITASETEICNGGQVTLTANLNNWNTPNMQYQWFANGAAIPGATSLSYTVAPSATTVYTFSAEQLNSLCSATSNSITVNVTADPVVTVVADLAEVENICDGRAVTFTATVAGGVTGGEVFTWYRNGVVIPNAVAATFTETVHAENNYPTEYTYAVSVKQTANGCESNVSNAVTFTVNPNPTVAIATDPIVCVDTNGNIEMTAHVDPMPATPYTFTWFEDNAVLTESTTNHIVLTRPYRDYPYNFSVALVNDYGCQAVAEAHVYVDENPVVAISATENDICVGGEVTLTANLNNWNTPNMLYQWYDNGEEIVGATSLTYTIAPTRGSHNYTFNVEQLNSGCAATSSVENVTVHRDPVVTVTNDIPQSRQLCDGRSVTFTAHVSGGVTGGEVYTWYRNGVVIPNAVAATFTETVHAENDYPTTYSYAVSVRQFANGCESDVRNAGTVTVNPNPTVVISTDPIVCENGRHNYNNIHMTANVYPAPTTNYSFTWFEDNAVIHGASGNHNQNLNISREYRDYPYNFSVALVNNYGCQAEAEATVYVDEAPVINIAASESNICEGGEITLTANLNNWNTPNMQYQWYDNNHAIAGATSLTYTVVPALGNHHYTFTAEQLNSHCHATSNVANVTVNADPVIASVTLSDYVVCQGAQIAVTANAGNYEPSSDDVYTWFRNGIVIPGATAQTIYDSPVTVDNNTQQFIYTAVVTRAAAGCTSQPVAANALTIYPNPTVVITGDQHVCETDSIFLVANVDTIGANVGNLHYTWYESGMIRDNMAYHLGDNRFYAEYWYPRAEPYRFTVEVQRDDVASACASRSAEFLVYVYPQPVVNITADQTEICENGEVTLTANLVDPNADNIIYQWYEVKTRVDSFAVAYDENHNFIYEYRISNYRSIIPGANSATYTANYAETATIGVTVMQTPSTCTDNDEIVITVNPRPVVTNVTVNNTAATTVCEGAQVTLAASIEPAGAEGAVFTWFRDGVVIPGAQLSTFSENVYTTDNHVTTHVYTAMVTLPASGCVSNISEAHADVTVNPAPTTVSISGLNVVCEGDSAELSVYTNVEGNTVWSNGSHESSITVPAGVYTVTVVTAEGCEMTSEPFTVNAFGSDLFVTASETSICQGEHTTLYANQDGYVGNVTYLWDANANNSTATTVDVQPNETTTYHVTATVNSTNGSCSVDGEITIVVNELPAQVTVTANEDAICQNQQITFTASGEASAYVWYKNGVEIAGENQATITVNFPEAGTYTFAAKAVSEEGCVSAIASEPVSVTVNPAPATVSITGNNVICEDDHSVLTAHSDVAGTFTWNDGTVGTTHTVVAGVYNVTLTTAEGCQMTSENFTVTAFGSAVQLTASETAICAGEHTTLYVAEQGWQGNVTYTWSNGSHASSIDVTPATTTTYYVTSSVNSTNGHCDRVDSITIVVTPLPAQVEVSASASAICEGAQVTFTASGNASAYVWCQNGVEIPGQSQSVLTVNFPVQGTYTFTAKAVNEEGCASAIASEPVTVTVNAAPESVTISGNLDICGNGHTTLYANVTPNVAGATYQWYKDNELAGTGHFLTVTEAGSYKVEVTTNGCTTVSDAVNVTVQEAPQLQLTATQTTICQNGTTVITAQATGWNNANVNYTWNNGFNGSVYTFNPTAAGDYTFSVVASQSTSGCTASDEITIHVNAAPAAPALAVSNAMVCEGAQITLTLTDTNIVNYGTPTIAWFEDGAPIAGSQNVINITPALGNHIYNATVTYPNDGCNTAYSEYVNVTVLPTPTVAVVTNGNTTICEGGQTTFTANVTPANGTYAYQWFVDNVEIAGANAASYTVANAIARETAYNYTVVVTSLPGCVATANAPALNVVADPVVVATVDNNIVCEGGQVTLNVTVDGGVANVNGLNGYTFAWYNNNDNAEVSANTPSFTVAANTPGNYAYYVVVTSPYGCQTTSNVVNYSVVADPTVNVAVANGYPTTICEGGSTMLVANVDGGYGQASYQWFKNGVAMVGENNQTLAVNDLNFVYTVEVAQAGVNCAAVSHNTVNPFTVAPAYTVAIAGNNNVCPGGSVTLTATVNNVLSNDVPTYQWYKVANGAGVAINGATSATYTTEALLLGGSYDYYVEVTSAISGCSVVSSTVTANVIAEPVVTINGAHSICEGELTLNAFVNGGVEGADYTYVWNWTGAANGQTVTATPTLTQNLSANDLATPYYFTVSINRNDNTGCGAASDAFEVNVYSTPAVTISANNTTVCAGGDVTFTANISNNNGGAYNYNWTINGAAVASNAASVTTSLENAGVINATVTVTAANASAACAATATSSVPVQVVADPVVTITANHAAMCAGGTTTLNANVNGNIAGDYSYQWAINGIEVAGAVAQQFVQQLDQAGTYTYTVRVAQNNNLGCASEWSAPATVLVAEQPVVALNNADGLDICVGGQVTLNGAVTNYGNTVNGVLNSTVYGPMTYTWLSNGTTAQTNANVNAGNNQLTQTINTIGNYGYSVVVTPTGYACQPAASNVVTVGVVGNPTWTDVHVYYPDVCAGQQVDLVANIEGGVFDNSGNTNGYIQWTVTTNGVTANVAGGQGGTTYDIPAVAGNYIYTPTFVGNIGNGCQFTNTADVQQPVTVHAVPTAQFVAGNGATICGNDPDASVEMVIAFTGGAPYTFDIVDVMNMTTLPYHTSATDTFTFYVAPSSTTVYRIVSVANVYCGNDELGAAAEATVNVNAVEFVETTFRPVNCGENVVINFNITSGSHAASYQVVENGNVIATGIVSENSIVIPDGLLSEGSHNLTLVIDGCNYNVTVIIPVDPASSEIFGENLMDQRWDDVAIINLNANPRYKFVGFQWYRNNELIPGAIYKNYQEEGGLNGFYSVEITAQDTETGEMVTFFTCPRSFTSVSNMKVYPVPATVQQVVTIELDLTAEELDGAVLDIFDATGKLINHVTDLEPVTRVAGFKAQGTYFGRILTGTNEIKTVKFVIVK